MFDGFDGWLRAGQHDQEVGSKASVNFGQHKKPYSVSEFLAHCNFVLSREFAEVIVEGEVAGYKVNQNRWVFFDLKEKDQSVNCFIPLNQLTTPLRDGIKVRVLATPKVTNWGKFSLTVQRIMPVGDGDIKKNFELLKRKLTAEGLFDPARKRPLPERIEKIGVVSSTGAAGYADFIKILGNRWGGLKIFTINTQVQGLAAPAQIIRALERHNQLGQVDVIAVIRGGGSADDLAAFNDEALVRAIAASKIPVITGIGHEVDESLADLAADVRASTPSNVAERLTADRNAISQQLNLQIEGLRRRILDGIGVNLRSIDDKISAAKQQVIHQIDLKIQQVEQSSKILETLNPEAVLRRGYAILSSDSVTDQPYQTGDYIRITTAKQILTTEVKNAQER